MNRRSFLTALGLGPVAPKAKPTAIRFRNGSVIARWRPSAANWAELWQSAKVKAESHTAAILGRAFHGG